MNASLRRRRWPDAVAVAFILLVAAFSFLTGITWGLPSRDTDPYLFGDRAPWTGDKIIALAPKESDDRGADVDANPIVNRDQTVVLNATDGQRAEIIRRYRLFSYQPDEMITFMSLSRIRENHGDPRLYQYGGLWIYPVGALIKVVLNPKADQAFYLDHPEAFGRFYVVARVYCAVFGIAGAWAVYWIIRRLSGGIFLPMAGGICYAMVPVVVNMAHEAKPHLPATVLMLLAVIAAAKFIDSSKPRWAALTGALCGAAFGMTLTAMVAFSIPFVMIQFSPVDVRGKLSALAIALAAGVVVFSITNPFVIINTVFGHEQLHSNLHNSLNMYEPGTSGLRNSISLVIEGTSPMLAIVGVCGAVFLFASAWARWKHRDLPVTPMPGRLDVAWLLAAPAICIFLIFCTLGARKPPEYARFAMQFDVALLIAAFAALGRMRYAGPRCSIGVVVILLTSAWAFPYWRGFIRDSSPVTSRLAAAEKVKSRIAGGATTVRCWAEPAPYAMPPVDLFRTRLLLIPPGPHADPDVTVLLNTIDAANPISWADAHFFILPLAP